MSTFAHAIATSRYTRLHQAPIPTTRLTPRRIDMVHQRLPRKMRAVSLAAISIIMNEALPIMAIIGLGALLVAVISATLTASHLIKTKSVRLVTIGIIWATFLFIIGLVGPNRLWRSLSESLESLIKNRAETARPNPSPSATPSSSPTATMPLGTPLPKSQEGPHYTYPVFKRALKDILEYYAEAPDLSSGYTTADAASPPATPSPDVSKGDYDSDLGPTATPIDLKSYVYLANTTNVDLTIDVDRNSNWVHYRIQVGSGIVLDSDFSNMFVRVCPNMPYKKFNGRWTVYPKRKKDGHWLPKHEFYVDKSGVIQLRPAGLMSR